MTDQDLRDLLQERVSDVTTTDLSATAWRTAARLRRRRRIGVVAGVTAGTLAVAGVTAVVDGTGPGGDGDPATSSPTPDEPDATVGGAPVWWSPDPAEESALPEAEDRGPLPEIIDLDPGAPSVQEAPVERAVAAFGVYDARGPERVVLLTPDGFRTLELPDGSEPDPAMLAPDGTSLHASSPAGGSSTYSFADGRWRGERVAAAPAADVPPQVAAADPFGPPKVDPSGRRTAQAYGFGSTVPARDGAAAEPETVVVTPRLGPPTILAITAPVGDLGGRYQQCCAVAGWLDDETLVYDSRSAEPRLVGWDVGTGDFELVSRIVGLAEDESYVASFARLHAAPAVGPGAPDADVTVDGAAVWWGPDVGQEAELPWLPRGRAPLAREIAVPDRADELGPSFGRAVGAFAPGDGRVLLLGPDGSWASVDVAGRGDLGPTMLSADGRRLVLVLGRQINVLDLETRGWSGFQRRMFQPGRPETGLTGASSPVGPPRTNASGLVAQAWMSGGPMLPVPDVSEYYPGPSYLTVTGGGATSVLALPTEVGAARDSDPTVAGWLDEDTVVYESRAAGRALLIAWDVGTRDLAKVTAFEGSKTSSFALLPEG